VNVNNIDESSFFSSAKNLTIMTHKSIKEDQRKFATGLAIPNNANGC